MLTRKSKTENPKPARSLTTILTSAFFFLSIAILLLVGGFSLYANLKLYQEGLAVKQQSIGREAGRTVANFVEEKFNMLETAVRFINPSAELENRVLTMDTLVGASSAFQQFALLDAQSRQLAGVSRNSSALSAQFTSQLNEDVFAKTLSDKRYISPVYIEDLTSEPLVVIAVPVKDVFGDIHGTLAAEVNLKFMWEMIGQLGVGETGYAYVVDSRGNLIAHEDIARVLRGENVSHIFEVREFVENPSAAGDVTPEVNHYNGLSGEKVVGSYEPLGTPPWAVVIEIPMTEAYQPFIQTTYTAMIAILVIVFLSGLIGNFLARRLSKPIVDLSKVATEIGGGNLFLQAEVSGPAETANLASVFNFMNGQLRGLVNMLEERVRERTTIAETARAEAETAAAEAQTARKNLETQMWLATGQTQLADAVRGEQDISQLAGNVISQVCRYTGAQAGALFLLDKEALTLAGRYAFTERPGFDGQFQLGEGLVGQAALDGKVFHLEDIPNETTVISTGLVNVKPRQVIAVPFYANDEVVGVLELARLSVFTQTHFELLERVSESIGVAFRTLQTQQRLADLLMESQQQAEELQTQEEELRAANEELHAQAENLRVVREHGMRK